MNNDKYSSETTKQTFCLLNSQTSSQTTSSQIFQSQTDSVKTSPTIKSSQTVSLKSSQNVNETSSLTNHLKNKTLKPAILSNGTNVERPLKIKTNVGFLTPQIESEGAKLKLSSKFDTSISENFTRKFKPSKSSKWQKQYQRYIKRSEKLLEDVCAFMCNRHASATVAYRTVSLNLQNCSLQIDDRANKAFCNNKIRSSIYTYATFLPKQLLYQFSKLANLYFLIISILQLIPRLSTTGRFTTIIPLMTFISISMILEGYQDYKRALADKKENNQIACVQRQHISKLQQYKVRWKELRVGDIIQVNEDETIPADILLLYCSEGANCYVETAAIDGESAPKQKCLNQFVNSYIKEINDLIDFKAKVSIAHPNADLNTLDGKLKVGTESYPLTANDFLYRGTILRHTTSVVGLIVYTGDETKSRMNAISCVGIKKSKTQRYLNQAILLVALMTLLMTGACTFAHFHYKTSFKKIAWYLNQRLTSERYGVLFFSNLILFNTLVPLSLYVCMEIVKLSQSFFIENDLDIYDETTGSKAQCQTSAINEELGQITHIFADKTGTLTKNQLLLRKISVGGYSWSYDSLDLKTLRRKSIITGIKKAGYSDLGSIRLTRSRTEHLTHVCEIEYNDENTVDKEVRTHDGVKILLEHICNNPLSRYSRRARLFLIAIALCHSCLIDDRKRQKNSSLEDEQISYISTSPDDIALVTAAKEMGIIFWEKEGNNVVLKVLSLNHNTNPQYEKYEILHVIGFSSQRRRMSVVVRMPNKKIIIFCKGADSIIIDKIANNHLAKKKYLQVRSRIEARKSLDNERSVMLQSATTEKFLKVLRPISYGYKRPDPSNLESWLQDRHEMLKSKNLRAPAQMSNRHSFTIGENLEVNSIPVDGNNQDLEKFINNDEKIYERSFQDMQSFAEQGLRILLYGYRIIEPEEYEEWASKYNTASMAMTDRSSQIEEQAEILERRLEFLGVTGLEDELQEGVSQTIERLLRANIVIWMLTGDKRETATNIAFSCGLIKDYSHVIRLNYSKGKFLQKIRFHINEIQGQLLAHIVLVIDGTSLSHVFDDPDIQDAFSDLAIHVQTVVCCRSSPSQKAKIVLLVKTTVKDACTLAIGDGANDVSMIRTANVGVGIIGKEGTQASRSSDFAIGQFRFLNKLLLVHGRWNYTRICKYTLTTFYKETFFFWLQAIYQYFNSFTSTSLYENWSLSMFNTLFTSLSVFLIGIFERDLSKLTLLTVPEVYVRGQKSRAFNIKVVLGWLLLAISQAFIVYLLTWVIYGNISLQQIDLYPFGTLIYSIAVISINIKICYLEMRNWTIFNHMVFFICTGGWFIFCIILSLTYQETNAYLVRYRFINEFGKYILWWLVMIIMIIVSILWDFIVRSMRIILVPNEEDVLAEVQRDPSLKKVLKDDFNITHRTT